MRKGDNGMGRSRSRARSPEDQEKVRARFLECARKVFAEDGAHGLTMRRLATEAGYSPGTIYLYFPSRHDLLQEVWKEDMVALKERMLAFAAPCTTPAQRIRAMLLGYADFWFAKPDHFKAMFLEVERQYVTERAAFAKGEVVQDVHETMLAEVRAAQEAGELPPEKPVPLLCHSILAAVHGVVCFHIANPGFPWYERSAMLDTVLSALLPAA